MGLEERAELYNVVEDESLEDSDDLLDLVVLAQKIVGDMQTALDQFAAVVEGLKG
jgi:hypothetical protein